MNYLVEDSTGKLSVVAAQKLREMTHQNDPQKLTVHGRLMPVAEEEFGAVILGKINEVLMSGERLTVA